MALLWVITCSSVSIVFNIPVLFTVVYAEKIRGGHVEGFCKQVRYRRYHDMSVHLHQEVSSVMTVEPFFEGHE